MLNNYYKYPHYYPQPELLKDEYRYAADRFEMELPLPSYSIKMPYQEKPARFLTVNRRKVEIDYLKSHIQHKCDMEQLHYQAKIEQMKRENQYNRQKLEQLLREQPPNLFQIPDQYTEQARSVSSNLQKISLHRLQNQKQKYLIDSIDKLKMQNRNRNSQSLQKQNISEGQSQDSQEEAEQKKRRQSQLDYVYKRNGTNNENHFESVQFKKKEQQKMKEKQKQLKEDYEWIQKVRKAKAVKFVDQNDSDDSSKPSEKSSEKSKKQAKQEKKSQKQQQIKSNRTKGIRTERGAYNKQPIYQQKASIRSPTPSNSEDISNISDYSRYAKKKQIRQKINHQKKMQNIFERDDEDEEDNNVRIPMKRLERKNWKT